MVAQAKAGGSAGVHMKLDCPFLGNDKDTFYLKYGDAPFLIFSILTLLFGFYQRKNEE